MNRGAPMAARGTGAIRTQGAFRGRAFPRRSINTFSSPNAFVSTCGPFGCDEFAGRRRFFNNFVVYPTPYTYYNYATYPYGVVPLVANYSIGNPLTGFGTCQAVDGVGVVNNSCAPGLVAIPEAGSTCTCYDRTTGASGCANVSGATCSPIVPSPFV